MDLQSFTNTIPVWIARSQFQNFTSEWNLLRQIRSGQAVTIGTCRSILANIVNNWQQLSDLERTRWLNVPLSCGNDIWRRNILDQEIIDIGKYEPEDLMHVRASRIFESMIAIFPDLLESLNEDNHRSLFHVAAINKAHEVITSCHRNLVAKYGTTAGRTSTYRLIMKPDVKGLSALYQAVDLGNTRVVQKVMALCQPIEKISIVPILIKAIQLKDMKKTQAILTIYSGEIDTFDELQSDSDGQEVAFHQSFVTVECFRAAIAWYDANILAFLLDQNIEIIRQPDCTLLHDAIREGLYDAVELLVRRCPDLVLVRKDEQPVLRQVTLTSDDGHKIFDLILPILMKRLEISALREHLPIIPGFSCQSTTYKKLTSADARFRGRGLPRSDVSDGQPILPRLVLGVNR